MKNIYEDSHNIPASDADSGKDIKIPSGIIEEQPFVQRERRPYRSAEEKREKRAARLESSAARRAERDRAAKIQQEQQYQYQPQYQPQSQPTQQLQPSEPAASQVVPVAPQYYIQQSPGQPPQLLRSQDTQSSGQSQQPAQAYTQGMKIVYQSPDFDRAPTPSPSALKSPSNVTPPAFQQTTVPDAASQPVKQNMPKYSAGHSFEQEIKRNVKPADSFSVKDVDVTERRVHTSRPSFKDNVEEITLDTAKKDKPLEVAEEHAPIVKKKKEAAPTSEKIRVSVLIVSIIVAIGALAYLVYEWKQSSDNKRLEESLSVNAESDAASKKPANKNEPTTKALTPEEIFEKLKLENPNIAYPAGMQARFAQFYTDNQEFVGYLAIDGLDISLPIVQTDNDQDYLKKNFYGKKTKYGCPFVLHLNSIQPFDKNTVIFGHYMKDGSIFAPLHEYKSIEGYRKSPVIKFDTLYGNYAWKIIACFLTNAYPEDDNDYVFRYYFTNLGSEQSFKDYLRALSIRSLYNTGVDVLPSDNLLTLSTCSYEFTNARFVVVARQVRIGESADVDVSKAVENKSPRYPQSYYDKKKLKNPYDDTYNWYVS